MLQYKLAQESLDEIYDGNPDNDKHLDIVREQVKSLNAYASAMENYISVLTEQLNMERQS